MNDPLVRPVRVHPHGREHTVAIDPFGDLSATPAARAALRLSGGAGARGGPAADHARARRPQRRRGGHRRPPGRALDRGPLRDPDRRGDRGRVRARRAGRHGARARTRSSCFELDGTRVCHIGDFGQAALRPEQRDAIGDVDVLFVPVGGGPTLDAAGAAEIVTALRPRGGRPDALPHRCDRLPRAGRRLPGALRRVGDGRSVRPGCRPPRPAVGSLGGAAAVIAPGR